MADGRTTYARVRDAGLLICDSDVDDDDADATFGETMGVVLALRRRLKLTPRGTKLMEASREKVEKHLLALQRDLVGRHVCRALHLYGADGRREGRTGRVVAELRRYKTPDAGTSKARTMSRRYARWTGLMRSTLIATDFGGGPETDPVGRKDAERNVLRLDGTWAAISDRVRFEGRDVPLDELLSTGLDSLADARRNDAVGAILDERPMDPASLVRRWNAASAELYRVAAPLAQAIDARIFAGEPPQAMTHLALRDRLCALIGAKAPHNPDNDVDSYIFQGSPPPARYPTTQLLGRTARMLGVIMVRFEALPPDVRETGAAGVDELCAQLLVWLVVAAQRARTHHLAVDLGHFARLPSVADFVAINDWRGAQP